ncbi:hypothetical protein C7387_3161 [Yokenella regensburgei]|uniref:MFS transporter n=1 Tax=Yokenella regensburgei TaxID=158877 RepID=A0ABX9RUJ9_9ENTR|nr:hypothetical protein [Yokenella regensburgei]RKR53692.1 hypothetical protein C7387_3161 [Yokenella regensburgei]VFS15073.1 Uncharacterised protein [Yokenella regensburgei]
MRHIWGYKREQREKRLKEGRLSYDKLTTDDKLIISMRKDFESGKAPELYLLWHSVLTAISFAFFIGLFSAEGFYHKSYVLISSSIFFTISLVMNGIFSIFYQAANKMFDGNHMFKIHLNNKIEYARLIALLSPFIATLLLIFFYSILATILGIMAIAITGFIFYRAINHDLIKLESEIRKQWRNALKNDDIETLDRIERRYG